MSMISIRMMDRGWVGCGAGGKRQLETRQDACFLGEAGGRDSQVEEQGPKSMLAYAPHPQASEAGGSRLLKQPSEWPSRPPGSLTLV